MKKFMRIALVFALAGAALVGCTKDYSGDISDLNKEVSAIQSTLTSLQTSIQGAQSAADAAAATANTALSAAKAAATADDLKAVQTALAAAATSAELTAVDAKYAAYIPAIDAAAKASDLEALETAIKAAIAATDVKVADLEKALEAYAKKADLDEAVTKLAALETNYIALEARVAKLEAAEKEIRDLIAENKAGIEANAEDIAALQELVEELTAQVEGNFSVEAIRGTAKYATAKWTPDTDKTHKGYFAKLVEEFPELAELKKDDVVETFGHINFIVNPSSVVLDDTYTFALVGTDGTDYNVKLGNPTKGYATKAGLNVWNVEVQSPAYDEDGEEIKTAGCWYDVKDLALVVENAEGIYAQTGFSYNVKTSGNGSNLNIDGNHVTFAFDDTKSENSFDAFTTEFAESDAKTLFDVESGVVYDNYFIIEADPADVEKYGIELEKGNSTISFTKAPAKASSKIEFEITAVGVNGHTAYAKAELTLKYTKTIAPNAELKAQTITLGYDKTNGYDVPVTYDVADFEFTAAQWKEVYDSLKKATTIIEASYENADGVEVPETNPHIRFFDKDGKDVTNKNGVKYSDVAAFGFYVDSKSFEPETYTVVITSAGNIFKGEGELTVQNPEADAIKLVPALCKDDVLQVVGKIGEVSDKIEYDLKQAFVNAVTGDTTNPGLDKFKDLDAEADDEYLNWTDEDGHMSVYKWGDKDEDDSERYDLYKVRNFSVDYHQFGNVDNTRTFEFQAEVVSPVYDKSAGASGTYVKTAANQNIYFTPGTTKRATSFEISSLIPSSKYAAGPMAGDEYNVFNIWKLKSIQTSGTGTAAVPYVLPNNGTGVTVATGAPADQNNYSTKYGAQVIKDSWGNKFANVNLTGDINSDVTTFNGSNSEATADEDVRLVTFFATETSNSKLASASQNATLKVTQELRKVGQTPDYVWGEIKSIEVTGNNANVYMKDEQNNFIKIGVDDANLLRGFGLVEPEIEDAQLAGNDLFLTMAMVDNAQTAWLKYYNNKSEKLSAKTKKDPSDNSQATIYYGAYCIFANYSGTFDEFKNLIGDFTKSQIMTGNGVETLTERTFAEKLGTFKVKDTEKNAVNAFQYLVEKGCFTVTVTAAKPAEYSYDWEIDDSKPKAGEIAGVVITFDEPEQAAKFIAPASTSGTTEAQYTWKNPYEDKTKGAVAADAGKTYSEVIKAKEGYDKTSITGGKVVLNAKIKITDTYGMVMEIPFTVTVNE